MKKQKKKLIYFVEDDRDTIDVYRIPLEQAGFEVKADLFGSEAIKRMEKINAGDEEKPDMVLLDLLLPDMNGIQILDRIRKMENIKDMPVIIISNYSGKELAKMGYDLGSENFITKIDCLPSQMVEIMKQRLGVD